MKEKKRDKELTKEAIGDPAFYNDQIGENNEPGKSVSEKRVNSKRKNKT